METPARAGAAMAGRPTVLISINTSWNIVNFRAGLIRALIADGYNVVAAAPADDYSPKIGDLGCRYVRLPMDNKGTSPLKDLGLLVRYVILFRRLRPDIFLGYTIKPNIYGSLAAHLRGIPTINNVSGLGTAFISQSWLTRLVKILYRVAFSRAACVFFQNRDDRDLFVRERMVAADRTAIVPGSGVDLKRFQPAPMPPTDQPVRFLLVARLLWDKGIQEFVEAARIVRRQVPDTRFQLLGFLDVENRTAVSREAVDDWRADGVIEYLGSTDDVRPHLAAADCIVLPSYREGTPRSLLEGAAMGKPLIATDVPGCREVVDDGVNGFLCPARDATALADQMLRFLALADEQRREMGQASRRKVEAQFDEAIVVSRYLAAIRRSLGRSRA